MLVGRANAWNKWLKLNLTGLRIQLTGGKPASYLQAWSRIWTRDYHEQIQLAVRTRLELGASELQIQRSNHSAYAASYTAAS